MGLFAGIKNLKSLAGNVAQLAHLQKQEAGGLSGQKATSVAAEIARIQRIIDPIGQSQKQVPLPTNISGQASDEIRRRQRSNVSGRADTVVTGELSPKQVGKKTLLGR